MVAYLSEAWLASYAEAGAALPPSPGCDAIVSYEVTGTPEGKVRWHEIIEDGVITAVAEGRHGDADVSISWKYDEALRLLRAEIDADASFMSGRTKVEGDYVRWLLGLRPMRTSEAHAHFLAGMAAITD